MAIDLGPLDPGRYRYALDRKKQLEKMKPNMDISNMSFDELATLQQYIGSDKLARQVWGDEMVDRIEKEKNRPIVEDKNGMGLLEID